MSMLFVQLFIHTRECDHSNQVCVEPVKCHLRGKQTHVSWSIGDEISPQHKYLLWYCGVFGDKKWVFIP